MPRHRDLIGVELHNARISLEAPTRPPAYIGETVFDGTVLWVANGTTATDWRRSIPAPTIPAPPLVFGWALNLGNMFLPSGTQISLYYRAVPVNSTWTLLNRYTTGVTLPVLTGGTGAINLNSWVEQRGLGLYMPLLVRPDNTAQPTSLSVRSQQPEGLALPFTVGRWAEPNTSRVYDNALAFEVRSVLGAFVGDVLQVT
ncbi:hypothetical protein H6F67_10950 [Microcoleus sp. FACHB-1515]|uniref:hypothetical protein n=1 Tax=Cyanophyceae TaxID=3028117 RepID=UPI00168896DB|nr:hypothetical protein [Microcoleus sp. FACHB-1515]MBD2090372.1 hypothetical protein [Microcoleus sp. FACHB-1515]